MPRGNCADGLERWFVSLASILLFFVAPLTAQTYVTGVLDHIEVIKSPDWCTDFVSTHQNYPPASTFSVSVSGSCHKSTTTIDFSLSVPLTTSRAEVINTAKVRFESGLPTRASARATFSIPDAWGSWLIVGFPTEDLDPSSGYSQSNGTCMSTEVRGGKNGGTWTSTATAPDCVGNKEQALYVGDDGGKYFVPNVEASTNLLNGGLSDAEGMGLQVTVQFWYRMSPPNKVTITSTTPAAGERQDPNGGFKFDAAVTTELNSDDEGNVILRLYQADGSLVAESGQRAGVKRGSSSVSLAIGLTDMPEPSDRGPRNPVLYRLIAVLLGKSGQNLAQSPAMEFPVWCDLKIDHLEGIQVTQHADNSIPLVAHKLTGVRVYTMVGDYKENGGLPDVEVSLHGYRDGIELPGSPLESLSDADTAYLDADRERNLYPEIALPAEWTAAGTITLRAQVNPPGPRHYEEKDATNNEASLTLQFQDMPGFSIRTLRVCQPGVGRQKDCAKGMGLEAFQTLFNMLPVSTVVPDGIDFDIWDTPPLEWPSPLNTAEEWDRLIRVLEATYGVAIDWENPLTQLMAWLPASAEAHIPGGHYFVGLSSPIWAGFSGRIILMAEPKPNVDERAINVSIAHEVGHNLGLTHTDPPPDCASDAAKLGEIGMQMSPYNFFESRFLQLMLYCDPSQMWISPSQYMWIWDNGSEPTVGTLPPAGAPAANGKPNGKPAPAARARSKAKRAAGAPSGTCALIQGTAQRETASATFDNVLRVPCSSSFADAPSGNHCMRFLDGGGAVLGEWCFPIPFAIPEVPGQLSEQGFVVKAPLPDATQRIALMRGDQELVSRMASANPPQVTFTTPQAGDRWTGGAQTLSWNGTDPDGDSLTYTVQYSADNRATWLPLKIGFSDTSLTLDPSQIRGGKNVFFRVLASDGFYTTTADAGPIEVVQTPSASVSPSSLDFLNLLPGTNATQRVQIQNNGSGPLTVKSASAGGMFQVQGLLPIRVPAGDSRPISIQFRPTAAGAATGTLVIATDDPAHAAIAIPLAGTEVASNTPEIEALPASLDFGYVAKDKTADLTVRVRNRGPAALTLKSVAVDAAPFRVTALAQAVTLQAAGTYEVTVTFAPSATGAVSGNLTLSSDDPKHGTLKIPLKGAGVVTADSLAQVQPASLDFGDVTVGKSKDLTLSIANAGGSALTVKTLATGNSHFSLTGATAPFTLGPGSQQVVTVRFQPDSAGSQTGKLTLVSNDPAHPSLAVPMTGTGQAAPIPNVTIDATPTALDFGSLSAGATKDLGVTVTAKGTDALVISSFTIDNPSFKVTSPTPPFTFGPAGSTSVSVRFSPTAAGRQVGTLTINSNASNQPAFNVTLTGTGVTAATVELKVDDGTYETKVGYAAGGAYAYFVNRLTPPAYPATLQTVRIFFHGSSGGLPPATQFWVLAGANSSGSATIDNLILRSTQAQVKATGQFNDYDVTPITIESGDFVVGFYVFNPPQTYPAALDTNAPYAKRSYTSIDGNTFTTLDGNFGIRALATVSSGGR